MISPARCPGGRAAEWACNNFCGRRQQVLLRPSSGSLRLARQIRVFWASRQAPFAGGDTSSSAFMEAPCWRSSKTCSTSCSPMVEAPSRQSPPGPHSHVSRKLRPPEGRRGPPFHLDPAQARAALMCAAAQINPADSHIKVKIPLSVGFSGRITGPLAVSCRRAGARGFRRARKYPVSEGGRRQRRFMQTCPTRRGPISVCLQT